MIGYSYIELIEMLHEAVMSDVCMPSVTKETVKTELNVLMDILWAYSE